MTKNPSYFELCRLHTGEHGGFFYRVLQTEMFNKVWQNNVYPQLSFDKTVTEGLETTLQTPYSCYFFTSYVIPNIKGFDCKVNIYNCVCNIIKPDDYLQFIHFPL